MEWTEMMEKNESSFWGLVGFRLLTADKEKVELAITADQQHLNTIGIVHGGVLSAMMDQAMGTLVSTIKDGRFGVTTHLDVKFLTALKRGELIASAYPIHETYRTMTLRAEVRNEEGILGCISTATFRLPKVK